jgi:hypothetical protein
VESNSDWISFKVEVNRITGSKPIRYRNGEPVFDEWAKEHVILTRMTGTSDLAAARSGLQRQYPGRWSSNAHVERWERGVEADNLGGRLDEPYTWHHEPDVETMSLVPRELNAGVPHLGGGAKARLVIFPRARRHRSIQTPSDVDSPKDLRRQGGAV